MTDTKKVAAVVGVGPGLGGALARRFANDGYHVASVARREEVVNSLAEEIGGKGYTADARNAESLQTALASIQEEMGPIDTLLWNVGSGVFGDLDSVGVDGLDLAYETNTRGLLVAVKAVVPAMRERGEGNIIITGATASLRGKPFTTVFAAGKAAQRSLAESLARQLWPEGIHVALIIVDGMVDLPSTRERMPEKPDDFFVSPEGYADVARFLCEQRRGAWTFQLEVRPSVESW